MKILVTAFGPFDGRAQNASSLALFDLKRRLPTIRTRILPADSVVAPLRLKQAIRQLRPDAILMLGEAAGSTAIRLEMTAWNEFDFSIPDIAGRWKKGPIIPAAPPTLPSTLPLGNLQQRLNSTDHPVTLSHNPGRYLCNQVFYQALHHLQRHKSPCPAGFIHLPLATQLHPKSAADALQLLVHHLGKRK